MTDELLYERLALSIVDGSVLPTLHGERADVYAFLYPLLLAPVLAVVELPDAIRAVHALNGVLFASASIPTYLLARELALPRFAVAGAAVFSVALPWTVIGAFVMTEAAAYPAALWALLAMQRAIVAPTPRRDGLALGAIAVATLARPQLAALGGVLLVAAVAHELRFGRWRPHWPLVAVAVVAVPVALLGGAGLLGSYAPTVEGDVISREALRSAIVHIDATAAALGVVPVLLGLGWSLAAIVRRPDPTRLAFAEVVAATTAVLAIVSGSVVVRFGLGIEVKDRYFFYVAPLLFLATACALEDPRPRIAGLLAVTTAFVVSVTLADFNPVFGVNIDSPASTINGALGRLGSGLGVSAAEFLSIVAGLLAVLLFFALRRVPQRPLSFTVLGAVLGVTLANTVYTWDRLLSSSGPSGRPLTVSPPPQLSWVDAAIPRGSVAMLAYSVGQDWWPSALAWWDVEFWNKRVDRAYRLGGYFTYTPESFPRPRLRVDPRTGLIDASAPDYVVRTTLDARLRPAGASVAAAPDMELVDVEIPFRAAWMTLGLDPDGWTRSGRRAFLRVFPPAGSVVVRATLNSPEVDQPLGVTIGPISVDLRPTERREIAFEICVPEGGYTDVEITTTHLTTVRVIATNPPYASRYRNVGVRLSHIQTAPTGRSCRT